MAAINVMVAELGIDVWLVFWFCDSLKTVRSNGPSMTESGQDRYPYEGADILHGESSACVGIREGVVAVQHKNAEKGRGKPMSAKTTRL